MSDAADEVRPDELGTRRRDKAGRFASLTSADAEAFADGFVTVAGMLQPTGVRATLVKHFPAWELDEPLPLFLETLAVFEGAQS